MSHTPAVVISTPQHFDVRGGKEIVGRIRTWASSVASGLGADERATADIALAVSEAATNVVYYAYNGAAEYRLSLTARRIGERIIVRIRDYGRKFDPASVRPPNIGGEPTDTAST